MATRAWTLAALLAAVALLPPPAGAVARWSVDARWAAVVAAAAAASYAMLRSGRRAGPGPVVRAALWLAAAHALTAAASGCVEEAAFRTAQIAALAVAAAWASGAAPRPVLGALSLSGAATALLLTAQRMGFDPFGMNAGSHGPGAAALGHKGLAAAFVAMALPASAVLALERRAFLMPLGACAWGLVWCDTRAAWLGAAAACAVLGIRLRRKLLPALAVALAGGALAALSLASTRTESGTSLAANVRDRLAMSPGSGTGRLRLALWRVSLAAWAERPWLGHGPGAFAEAIAPSACRMPSAEWDALSRYAHNDALHILVEAGIPGALALALLGWIALRTARMAGGPEGAACAAGLAAGAVAAALSFPLEEPACALALASLAGLMDTPGALARPRTGLATAALAAFALSLRLPLAEGLAASGRTAPATRMAPLAPSVLQPEADEALSRGDAEGARHGLRRILRRAPGDTWAWSDLGQASLAARDLQSARSELEHALALGPWNATARIRLATLRFRQGAPADAYAILERCLKELPDFEMPIRGTWGILMTEEGRDPLGAIDQLERCVKLKPPPDQCAACERALARCRGLLRDPARRPTGS